MNWTTFLKRNFKNYGFAYGWLLVAGWLAYSNAMASPLPPWQQLAPGLEYTQLNHFPDYSNGYLHAFRIDLAQYNLKIGFTGTDNIPQLAQQNGAVVATNGGFFDPEFKSLGLRISDGRQLIPLKATAWWGIFYVSDNKAHIIKKADVHANTKMDFAIQAGPRLIVNNKKVIDLKDDIHNRTALGITKSGQVILLATENFLISTSDLAEIMQRPEKSGGLECIDAINLDGGSSTQIYAKLPGFSLQSPPGLRQVADAVLVVPK